MPPPATNELIENKQVKREPIPGSLSICSKLSVTVRVLLNGCRMRRDYLFRLREGLELHTPQCGGLLVFGCDAIPRVDRFGVAAHDFLSDSRRGCQHRARTCGRDREIADRDTPASLQAVRHAFRMSPIGIARGKQ